jgi:hypothetical protein
MVDALRKGCLMLLWAADPFSRVHALQFQPRIAAMLKKFDEMPAEEPTDVSVIAHFDEETTTP